MQITLGFVRSAGTRRWWRPRWYRDGFDFGFNLFPGKWGFYGWVEWGW